MIEPVRYFFVHMQKTAGTSLDARLRKQFPAGTMFPTERDKEHLDAVLEVDYLQRRFAESKDELRLVAGHFPLCTTEVLGVPFTAFTVLREPVARTLSFLRHHQRRGPAPEQDLEEIYARPAQLHGLIHNHMVKMLSMTADEMTRGVMTMVAFDDARLERAKERLEHCIDTFGVQERFDAFCDDLAQRYGWDLGSAVTANTTSEVPVSDEFVQRIAKDNAMDIELYDFAVSLLDRRASRPGDGR